MANKLLPDALKAAGETAEQRLDLHSLENPAHGIGLDGILVLGKVAHKKIAETSKLLSRLPIVLPKAHILKVSTKATGNAGRRFKRQNTMT